MARNQVEVRWICTTIKLLVYTLFVILLTACEASHLPAIPTLEVPQSMRPTPTPTTQQAIQTVLDQEVQATRDADLSAFRATLDPEADPAWVQKQVERIERVASPKPKAMLIERVVMVDEWALAAVILEQVESDESNAPSEYQTYTLRTLRNLGEQGWKLTSPAVAPWGELQTLQLTHLTLTYYPFDAPYVQAIGPVIESRLAQMAQDFGLSLVDNAPLTLHIVPAESQLPFWEQASGDKLPSPLTPGFSSNQAASPEEFLLGSMVDVLGHLLFARDFGITPQQEGRFRLGHTAIQWEVNEAVEKQLYHRLPTETAPLSALLDPTETFVHDSNKAIQRDAFLYFIVERYGREVIAPYLQAVFSENDWQGIISSAFGENPVRFEQDWRAWMKDQLQSTVPDDTILYLHVNASSKQHP